MGLFTVACKALNATVKIASKKVQKIVATKTIGSNSTLAAKLFCQNKIIITETGIDTAHEITNDFETSFKMTLII